MKKIILILLSLFCLALPATGLASLDTLNKKIANMDYSGPVKKVAVLLNAPMTYADNEHVRTIVQEKSLAVFQEPKFQLSPFDEAQIAMKIYREEKGMLTSDYITIVPLKMADVQAIGKQLDVDYVFFINVNNTVPRVGVGFFSTSFKTTITSDMRLMDVASGKYIVMKQAVKDGSSTAIMYGVPSFDKAYQDALSKSIDTFVVDTEKL